MFPGSTTEIVRYKQAFQERRDPFSIESGSPSNASAVHSAPIDVPLPDANAVASLLKLYLRELPDPLLDRPTQRALLDILDRLPKSTLDLLDRSHACSLPFDLGNLCEHTI